jgi:hypothetical protein
MHSNIQHLIDIYSKLTEFIYSSDRCLKQRNSKYTTRELLEFYALYFGTSSSTYSKISSQVKSTFCLTSSPSIFSYYNKKRSLELHKSLHTDIINIWYRQYPSSKQSIVVPGRRILAVDGSVVRVHIGGLKNDTVSHVTLCTITDISCSILVDVAVATDKDERKGFISQLAYVNKQDICVFDRGYFSSEFVTLINEHTSFVIRMKSNSALCSELQNSNNTSIIGVVNGVTVRVVKYCVDIETKQIIHDYYDDTKNKSDDDTSNVSEFFLCTNDLSLMITILYEIYKARWQSEVNHKALKQNYNIRTLCSTKSKSLDDIKKKCEINSLMITVMFNISRMIRRAAARNTQQ